LVDIFPAGKLGKLIGSKDEKNFFWREFFLDFADSIRGEADLSLVDFIIPGMSMGDFLAHGRNHTQAVMCSKQGRGVAQGGMMGGAEQEHLKGSTLKDAFRHGEVPAVGRIKTTPKKSQPCYRVGSKFRHANILQRPACRAFVQGKHPSFTKIGDLTG